MMFVTLKGLEVINTYSELINTFNIYRGHQLGFPQ